MAIVGVTHDKDGHVRLSRSITTKVAIGLPPRDGSNFPTRLDHFVFLKKVMKGKEIGWEPDQALMDHYTQTCREFWIVFLDDDPDKVFRTEVAAYAKRGCWCRGDGEKAERRDLGRDRKQWGDFKIFKGPCANSGCPEFEKGDCKPSGDLYFMPADFPTLGSIWRLHTSSYQSIRQIHSALQDLRRVTGGRLMGVTAKLFVHPDKNVYEQGGTTHSGTKWVLGLELRAADMAGMQTKLLETARVFQQIKGELGGQVLEIEEDEEERGPEITTEFYPSAPVIAAEPEVDTEQALREEADKLMLARGLNQAQRQMRLGQYKGRMTELVEKVKAMPAAATIVEPGTKAPIVETKSAPAETNPAANIHGLGITDDDLPDFSPSSPSGPASAPPSTHPRQAPVSKSSTKGGFAF
jgi:hypothetical protein